MKRIIFTEKAPKPVGPYSQGVEINSTLYIAGQVPIDPETGKMAEGGVREQTAQVMTNIGAILEAAGYSFADLVKTTCLLSDMADFGAMNEVYGSFFTEEPPARVTFAAKQLPRGALVEIEAVAAK